MSVSRATSPGCCAMAAEPATSPPRRRSTPGWRSFGTMPLTPCSLNFPSADEDGLFASHLAGGAGAATCRSSCLARRTTRRFAAEVVRAGAQDYLPKEELEAPGCGSAIRCAMERQQERTALIEEKDNYYGIFDHLVEGIFRTTPDGHYLLANVALARIYGYDSPVELMASIKDIARKALRRTEPARGIRPADAGARHVERLRVENLPQGRDHHLDFGKLPRRARRGREIALLRRHGRGHHRTQARRGTNPPRHRRTVAQPRGIARQKPDHGGKPAHGARNPDRHAAAAISGFSAKCPAGAERVSIRPPLRARRIRQRRFFQRLRALRHRGRRCSSAT